MLIVEYPLWRALSQIDFSATQRGNRAGDRSSRRRGTGAARSDGRSSAAQRRAGISAAQAREIAACIVYSSGTGGRPKGCVLTHENYLEQCAAVAPLWPFWPGARYLSIIPTNHAIDFMGGFIMPFTGGGTVVHLRTLRPEYIREAFTRYKITYMAVVPLILKNLERGLRERFAALPPAKRRMLNALVRRQSRGHARAAAAVAEPAAAEGYSRGVWRRVARAAGGRSVHRAEDAGIFPRSGHPDRQRIRLHGGVHGHHRERYAAVSARHAGEAGRRDAGAHRQSRRGRRGRSGGAQQNRDVALPGRSGD